MPRRLFGTNGIRGVVNRELTPEFITKLGLSIGTFFNGGKILLGSDCRTSSPAIKSTISGALQSMGCKVVDTGSVPTPALQYCVPHYRMDGGVMITASHNPPEYNGLKVVAADGVELDREREMIIEEIFESEQFRRADWNKLVPPEEQEQVLRVYGQAIVKQVDAKAIEEADLCVAVDPGNGVTALAYPQIFNDLGCRVPTINADIDGSFRVRGSEPRPDNVKLLSSLVKAYDADLGVAFDGDGDRSIFVDEKGQPYFGDMSFALIAQDFLSRHPGEKVVTSVSSTQTVREVIENSGGHVVWTKVGAVTISRTMLSVGALLGGEENGGVMYGPHLAVRDGAMATALILEILARKKRPVSQLFAELPKYFQYKDRVDCPEEDKQEALERLRSRVKADRMETLDGVKAWYADGSAILVRPSGTEPIFRIYAEAKTKRRVQKLGLEFKELLVEIVDRVK